MLSQGTTLGGRYRLVERIAGGGMGDVWRGTDEVLGRTVAVKVLLRALLEEPGFAERFHAEARTMATVNHPGVVDIYDYGGENDTAFLVMEYVEGEALSGTLNRVGRLAPARAMALVAQAADALQAAHANGIVHRDVKPGNLLVRPDGTLVLTDFGIARSAHASQLTAVGSVLGTASYISPEQAAGEQATPLSDIYALGVVAYQCLSGRRPFEGDNPFELAMRHVRDAAPPLPPDVPQPVRQVVERAMAKDPAARWASASAMAQAARQAATGFSGGATTALVPPSHQPPSATFQLGPRQPGTRPISGLPAAQGTRVMPPTGQAPPVGSYPVPASKPPYEAPSSQRRPGSARRNETAIAAALAVFLVVVLGVGGVYYLLDEDEATGGNPDPTASTSISTTSSPRKSATPQKSASASGSNLVSVDCKDLVGRPGNEVESLLRQLGFGTTTKGVADDRESGEVVDVKPCKPHAGDVVTIYVSNGKSKSKASASPTDSGSVSPKPSASCLIQGLPTAVCPTDGP